MTKKNNKHRFGAYAAGIMHRECYPAGGCWLETRVVGLETDVDNVKTDIRDIKADLRELRKDLTRESTALREDLARETTAIRQDLRRETKALREDLTRETTSLRKEARTDFRLLFSSVIFVALGLASLMAKGFHWF